jgi:protein involved in polysaccharide export with SLBB domain
MGWVLSLIFALVQPSWARIGLLQAAQAQHEARIHYGDTLRLFVLKVPELTGDFQVQDDGRLYLAGTGGIEVVNLTQKQAEDRVRAALSKRLVDPVFSLSLKTQALQRIYVVGGQKSNGFVNLVPDLDLRKVVAQSGSEQSPDLTEIDVYRDGDQVAKLTEQELLNNTSAWNGPLKANDVVVLQTVPIMRIWVSGSVHTPGRVIVPVGATVYQALAVAGDISTESGLIRDQMRVVVRRGDSEIVAQANPPVGVKPLQLEAGDTILVTPPLRRHIYATGEVKAPGEYTLPADASLLDLISRAGGLTPDASYGDVFLVHQGKFQVFHGDPVKQREELAQIRLGDEDTVYVPLSTRLIYVLGEVKNPGRYPAEDGHKYGAAEVLARAGGLVSAGTLRRVVIVRYGSDGKAKATRFNLDEFLKDGKVAANPEIEPGDFLFFGTPKGISFIDVENGLSTFVVLSTILPKL